MNKRCESSLRKAGKQGNSIPLTESVKGTVKEPHSTT